MVIYRLCLSAESLTVRPVGSAPAVSWRGSADTGSERRSDFAGRPETVEGGVAERQTRWEGFQTRTQSTSIQTYIRPCREIGLKIEWRWKTFEILRYKANQKNFQVVIVIFCNYTFAITILFWVTIMYIKRQFKALKMSPNNFKFNNFLVNNLISPSACRIRQRGRLSHRGRLSSSKRDWKRRPTRLQLRRFVVRQNRVDADVERSLWSNLRGLQKVEGNLKHLCLVKIKKT
jgi:hypothetical protein